MTGYKEDYISELNKIKIQKNKLEESINNLKNKINSKKDELSEKEMEILENQIVRRQNGLNKLSNELDVIRIGSDSNEREKLDILNNFYRDFCQSINDDVKLNFHGCRDLSLVKKIIESKCIVSGEDRTGVATSLDVSGGISVTTVNSLYITVSEYAGLLNKNFLPAGAIFVIKPDESYTEGNLITDNVYFSDEPNRLLAIISTTENQELLKKHLEENGLNPDLCITYNEFLLKVNDLASSKTL